MTLTTLTITNNIYRAYYSDETSLIISKKDAEGLSKTYNIRIEMEATTTREKQDLLEEVLEDIRIAKHLDANADTTVLERTADQLTRELDVFEKFEAVADNHNIPTLEVRNSDSLDFHEVFVGDLLEMMEYAYELGRSHS